MNLQKVFKEELCAITSLELRELIIACEEIVPARFWEAPASTSGEHHPRCSLKEGGLIRHTKLAIWWGMEQYRSCEHPYAGMADEAICALVLHDLFKPYSAHGPNLAARIERLPIKHSDSIRRVIAAIAGHMGRWTAEKYDWARPEKQYDKKTKDLCRLVHLADFCASCKVMEFIDTL